MKVKVIFRKYPEGDVFAIFPEVPGTSDWYTMLSFDREGHGSVDQSIVRHTKAAKPSEYSSMKHQLERLGYGLEVVKRVSREMTKERRREAGSW